MAKILDGYTISYAQNREDIIISSFFPDIKKGYYVDVGANHPLYHSVTKLFYDKGWRGVNIEPNPKLFDQISEHRSLDLNLMKGVGEKRGILKLRIYHSRDGLEGISTFSSKMKKSYTSVIGEDTKVHSDLEVEVVTLADIFSIYDQDIHFMKVDVEGYEYEVLAGNDWKRYRPELICIEANHIIKDWRPILKKAEYSLVFNDGLNDYYLRDESIARKKNFDYAKVFLLNKPVIGFEISEVIRSLQETSELTLIQSSQMLIQKQKEIDELTTKLELITPLRKHIKRQLKSRLNKKSTEA